MLALTQFVSRAARVNGDGVATICGGRRRTWGEFQDRVRRTAGALRALGLAPGERVAILSPNSDIYLEYLFAVPWAGGVTVPINTRLAPAEILYWLEDADCRILAVEDRFVETVNGLRDRMGGVDHLLYIGDGDAPEGYLDYEAFLHSSTGVEDAGRCDDDPALLCYTGGTTGRSKGVVITHGGMYVNILQWINGVEIGREDRMLVIPPMFHAAGCENGMALVALAATGCFLPQFDVLEVLRAVERERLTNIPLVATMLDMIVNHPQIGDFDLSSIRRITYGASPIPERVLHRSLEILPQVQFYQVFGQTEGGPTVSVLAPHYHVTEGPDAGKLRSAGRAVIGTEIAIVDEEGRELPPNSPGEIAVRGPGVSPGYWNLPEATQAARMGDWLLTGDAGYLDEDGFLFISDRIKDMIISGGENVYPAEVEAVLMLRHEIVECAVIGIPSAKWGEQVHGIVRLQEGHTTSEEELLAHCREHLAGYKCPRSFDFRQEPFPLSGANKILKRELRKPYWEQSERDI